MMRYVRGFMSSVEFAAGAFIAILAVLTFVAVLLRYFFSTAIPDSYDLLQQFLGISMFWGLCIVGFSGRHITVDILWTSLSPKGKWLLDIFAAAVTLVSMTVFTWMMGLKVLDTRADNILTYDLKTPLWVYYFVGWLGLLVGSIVLLYRLCLVVTQSSNLPGADDAPASE